MLKRMLLSTVIAATLSPLANASEVDKLIVGPATSLSEYESSAWYVGEKQVGDYVILSVDSEFASSVALGLSENYSVVNAQTVTSLPALDAGSSQEQLFHSASLDDYNDLFVGSQTSFVWDNHEIFSGMSNVRENKSKATVVVFADGSQTHADMLYSGGYNFASTISGTEENYESSGVLCGLDKGLGLSGVIAAQQNNGVGIAGIADVDLYMAGVDVADCDNGQYVEDPAAMFEALESLTSDGGDTGAPIPDVILITQGFDLPCPVSAQSVIDELVEEGSTIVVSAGDESDSAGEYYPANCNNVITVAGVYENGEPLTNANLSASVIDITAPGTVFTTSDGNSYGYKEGSDYAAAVVAGMVAMLKTNYPSLTPSEIETSLKNSASPYTADTSDYCFYRKECGAGFANADMLMDYAHSVYDPEVVFSHAFVGDNCLDELEVEALSPHMDACSAYVANIETSYAVDATSTFGHYEYQFKLIKRPEGVSVWYNDVNPSNGAYSEERDNGIEVVSTFSYDESRSNKLLLPMIDVDEDDFDYAIASCLPATTDVAEWESLGRLIDGQVCFDVSEIDVSELELPEYCD
jgi:hypothetical protein